MKKMNMKNAFGCLCAAAALNASALPTNDWENLAVNSINRMPPRTYSMPLADERAALTDALEPETPYKMSLNGLWKISWAGNPALRVKDFWKTGYDDSDWLTIDVPSCVELRGFGSPGYTNVRYPHAMKWPKILDRDTLEPNYNPVSSYRRTFTVPAGWKGRDVILRFDGVYSAYYVWVNGRKVGYAEDSKLPSEFDITPCLNADPSAPNVLCVEVYRWCDGSYLEDQDMFRYSGIFRDVTLWARPKDGLWDFAVKTTPVDGYEKWKLRVEVDAADALSLYDADKRKVCDLKRSASAFETTLAAKAWSAEKPYLYTLVLKKGADVRMKRIGFKEQKIVGNAIVVNGRKIKFKGVNRHECSVENGRTVSLDEMLADIRLMKRYNINTVRTSHYPNHRLWYDLCDRYGIYLCAEANVEGHEPGYNEKGLGRFPEWDHSIVERNTRHALFYRNNPSVTLWSMGNETGHGDCFRHAIAAVKKIDPSRPVHWERGNADADVDSKMYPTVEWLETRGKAGDGLADPATDEWEKKNGGNLQSRGKAFFMCEYAHAMGNAIGNFQEYWDVFYRYDSLAGGCIWDWVDQAIWKDTDRVDPKTGRRERYLAYGGDFDEEPNDGPFCCNGVIDPLRNVTAKLVEVGHVHRNLVVTRKADGACELWNRFGFTFADEFDGFWELLENGRVVKAGAFEVPHLGPLSRAEFELSSLGIDTAAFKPGAEYFLNMTFSLKRDELWAKKGWPVARNQLKLAGKASPAQPVTPAAKLAVNGDDNSLAVACGATKAVFCRRSGTLCELTMNGKTILRDPAPGLAAGPKFTCMRAFTDNDRWLRDGSPWGENRKAGGFYSCGLTQLRYHARPIAVADDKITVVTEVTGSKSAGFTHTAVWRFAADGAVSVENTVTPRGKFPKALPRLGLSLMLDPSLECLRYYGRGPRENYIDRKTGSFLGVWNSTVTEQYEPYVRPQDNGFKCDVRWAEFTDSTGRGVRFSASEPLFLRALHYSSEDLEHARHRAGQRRVRVPLVARPEVMLDLDVRQLGLGGASCGPQPMEKYVFPIAETSWTVRLEPVE